MNLLIWESVPLDLYYESVKRCLRDEPTEDKWVSEVVILIYYTVIYKVGSTWYAGGSQILESRGWVVEAGALVLI